MFLLTLLGGVSAWADFSQTWTASPVGPWTQINESELPSGVTASGTPYAYYQAVLNRTANATVTIVFKYTSGNHAVKILGIDLVNAQGTVVYTNYTVQTEGGTGINDNTQATYTFTGVAKGNYTLRYFVGSVTGSNQVDKTNGNITVTGLEQRNFIGSVNELRNDKVYVIKSGRTSESVTHYLLYHEDAPNNLSSTYGSGHQLAYTNTTENFHFAIQNVGGKYYFYNMAGDKFVGNNSVNDGAIPLVLFPTNDMEIRDCTSESVEYCFKLSTNGTGALNCALTNNCHGVVNWNGGYNNNDAGNRYQIIEIGDLSTDDQTTIQTKIEWGINYKTAHNLCSEASPTVVGAYTPTSCGELSNAVVGFYLLPNQANYNTMMTEYNNVINNESRVTLSKGEKFTVKCIDTSRGYLVYSTVANKGSETNAYLAGASSYSSYIPGLEDAGVYKEWAIYTHDGLQYLYNVQKQQYIKPTTPVQFCDDNHPFVLEQIAGTLTQWKIKFTENNNYLGFSPAYNNGQIVRSQTSTDNGNIFIIEKVVDQNSAVQSVTDEVQTTMASKILLPQITSLLPLAKLVDNTDTGVGKYSYSGSVDVSLTKTLAEKANPTLDEMETCANNLLDIERNVTINQPEVGKLYRFKCVGNSSGKRLTSTLNSSSQMQMGDDGEGNLQESIFYLNEGKKLLSYATGQYIGDFSRTTPQMSLFAAGSAGVAASFDDVYSVYGRYPGAYSIRLNNRNIYGADNVVNSGSDTEDRDGYFWTIEEVKWLPISVTNEYSKLGTFVSPVALKAASAGNYAKGGRLKFFTGKIDGNYFRVSEYKEDVIPANTPFLIEYQNGSAYENGCSYLQISDTDGTVPNNNDLEGGLETVATPTNQGTIYTLQKTGEDPANDKQEFRIYTGTNIKGFRAYLPSNGAQIRGMIFGGQTTDIEGAPTGETAAPIVYDLSGRRVQHATKGMYIVNGKKMYVK